MPTWASFVAAWDLFREPILAALFAGTVLGVLGVYVVLRRMVFVSAAVTQAAALGIAAALYLHIHKGMHLEPLLGAALFALGATALFATDPEKLRVPRESMLGLAFAFAGGAAVLVGDRITQEAHDLQSILFGSGVLVRPLDAKLIAIAGAAILVLQLWWRRGFAFASFDPDTARVQGLPVAFLNLVIFISVGGMVGVSTRALGSLPVFAFSVLPATAALLFGLRLPWAFVAAGALGAAAGTGGYLFAYFFQFPVGGSQTVIASAFAFSALAVRLGRYVWTRVAGRSREAARLERKLRSEAG